MMVETSSWPSKSERSEPRKPSGLHRPNVRPGLQSVRGKTVTEGMAAHALLDSYPRHRCLYRPVNRRFIQMMPPLHPRPGVHRQVPGWENILSVPFPRRVRILALQSLFLNPPDAAIAPFPNA